MTTVPDINDRVSTVLHMGARYIRFHSSAQGVGHLFKNRFNVKIQPTMSHGRIVTFTWQYCSQFLLDWYNPCNCETLLKHDCDVIHTDGKVKNDVKLQPRYPGRTVQFHSYRTKPNTMLIFTFLHTESRSATTLNQESSLIAVYPYRIQRLSWRYITAQIIWVNRKV